MKHDIDTRNIDTYTVISAKYTAHGIFFRNPIQKVCRDAYYVGFVKDDSRVMNAYRYMDAIKNPIRRFYEILLGNGDVVRNIEKWSQDIDFAAVTTKMLCSPIYFRREERSLIAIDTSGQQNISEIRSRGYESEFETCSGCCEKEWTTIKLKGLKGCKKIRRVCRGHYCYTYFTTIKDLVKED